MQACPTRKLFCCLRLAQILYDEADGLCREELGMGRLVTPCKSIAELFTAADPCVQSVQRHVWRGIGEVEHRQLRLSSLKSLFTFNVGVLEVSPSYLSPL